MPSRTSAWLLCFLGTIVKQYNAALKKFPLLVAKLKQNTARGPGKLTLADGTLRKAAAGPNTCRGGRSQGPIAPHDDVTTTPFTLVPSSSPALRASRGRGDGACLFAYYAAISTKKKEKDLVG
ncbi:hypothetical protein HPB48_026558 [Haemaphysalis longicornis]|uniref:Secreted protein n=1 Tax=Haemaphysalis longicornis TaxID=44386 RepID=A0A9J6H9T5_HAELO|nr:hypothetical protein HPB48_026558 [Haemaphysalis longicornis]